MRTSVIGGRASVSVTSGAEVDLLSSATTGVSVADTSAFKVVVETSHDITVRVYVAAGENCALALVNGWTTTATSAVPFVLDVSDNTATGLRVTGQAASTTATVNCDMRGIAS